jgi:protein phosphatase 1B
VDGDLAVSRAFGDFEYKARNDLPAEQQRVSPVPDIKIVERSDRDDVLILACDGLWDVMTSPEAVQAVREIYASGESNMQLVVEEMLDLALDKGK